jgi:6-pyruvoyltetrahydropterin/6-carboxytetrahydropterin synthase
MHAFKVRVVKDNLVFCAGHFITYSGACEPLHGHNYRAAVTLEGPLDESEFVFNFVTLKRMMKAVCDRLDHRMLLPTDNPHLDIRSDAGGFTVKYQHKTYVFPREDVVQLPIPNTTAEHIAAWIGDQLAVDLKAERADHVTALEIEVEETPGQSAICRKVLKGGAR